MVLNNLKGDTVSDFNPQFPSQVYDHRLCMGELWHNFEILPKNCALYQGNVIFEFLVICPFVLSMFLILHTPSVTAVWTVLNSHVISIPCVYQWLHMKCITHFPIFPVNVCNSIPYIHGCISKESNLQNCHSYDGTEGTRISDLFSLPTHLPLAITRALCGAVNWITLVMQL